ncbi:MAG: flagellar basal body P-ring formation chaperone FlgA [Armatimonadota bacterium]
MVLLVLLISLLTAVTPKAEVVFREEAVVRGPQILLADVAEIRSTDLAFAQALSTLDLGRAPLPGFSRILPASSLIVAMRRENLDPTSVQIGGAPKTRVVGESQTVTKEAILQAAEEELKRKLQELGLDADIRPKQVPASVTAPPGEVYICAASTLGGNGAVVRVQVQVNGKPCASIQIPYEVELRTPVLVAARDMDRGQVIQPDSVRLEKRKGANIPKDVCLKPEDAAGMRLKSAAKQGDVITHSMLEPVPLVNPRSPVEVVCLYKNVRVSVKGTALEDGALDQAVRVRLDRNREVVGIVKSQGLVEVKVE